MVCERERTLKRNTLENLLIMKIDSADIAGIAPIKFFVNSDGNLEIYPRPFVQFYQKCLESSKNNAQKKDPRMRVFLVVLF